MSAFPPLASLLTVSVLLVASSGAEAQVKFSLGPRIGIQRTHQSSYFPNSVLGDIEHTPYRHGFQAGIIGVVQFVHLAIQPALLFSQKGYHHTQYIYSSYWKVHVHGSTKQNLNYLELPVNFVFSTGKDDGFQVLLGGYAAAGIGGRFRQKSYAEEGPINEYAGYVEGSRISRNPFGEGAQRYDFGVNGGLGYKYKHLQMQIIYGLGLLNVEHQASSTPYGPSTGPRNRSLQLTTAYMLPFLQ